MPAAAVIPAPIAYIKVAAVKKLVVRFLVPRVGRLNCCTKLCGTFALYCAARSTMFGSLL